jgi:hypothetical protein
MPQKPEMVCPNCGELTVATVVNWTKSGPRYQESEPDIHYFLRFRRCSNCQELTYTAELDAEQVRELAELRCTVRDLREDADRAYTATKAIKKTACVASIPASSAPILPPLDPPMKSHLDAP